MFQSGGGLLTSSSLSGHAREVVQGVPVVSIVSRVRIRKKVINCMQKSSCKVITHVANSKRKWLGNDGSKKGKASHDVSIIGCDVIDVMNIDNYTYLHMCFVFIAVVMKL